MSSRRQHSDEILRNLEIDPSSFLDDVFNAVDEYLADSVDALESVLLDQFSPQSLQQKEATVNGVEALYDTLTRSLDKYWLKFEEYAQRNCFQIPDGFEIPQEIASTSGDESLLAAEAEEAALDERLQSLRLTLGQENANVGRLRRESRALDMEIQRHRRPAEVLKSIASQVSTPGGLVEAAFHLQSLMDRAKALRALHQHRNVSAAGADHQEEKAL